jgi:hypothetical protein
MSLVPMPVTYPPAMVSLRAAESSITIPVPGIECVTVPIASGRTRPMSLFALGLVLHRARSATKSVFKKGTLRIAEASGHEVYHSEIDH